MMNIGTPAPAKFEHENGTNLRLQAFLLVRDTDRRVACVRIQDFDEGWCLPGETLRVNEDPAAAAERVARSWFTTPLKPRLVDVQSYPATSAEDNRWYLLFIFEADAPAKLEGTPDTLEIRFAPPGKAPGPFAMDHASVFAKIHL